MPDPKTFPEFIDHRYGDRGGWKVLKETFAANLPYDQKVDNAAKTFRVSRSQVVGSWYPKYRAIVGLK